MSEKQSSNISKSCRPTILCGLSISCQTDKAGKSDNEETTIASTQLYLVVYDFMYTKEQEDTESDAIANIQTPCNHEENLSIYSTLYDGLDSNEFEAEDVSGYNLVKQMASYYKTFIPGESDEVFLPPSGHFKLTPKGPKPVHDTFDSKKSGFMANTYHQINTNQNCLESTDVSISDHIAEVSRTLF